MKETGLPLAEGLNSVEDLPHTITFAIMYRARIDSFNSLPKDKQPPRDLWDKPHRLETFLDHVWDTGDKKSTTSSDMYEFEMEDIE
jgi:hypothetical protein